MLERDDSLAAVRGLLSDQRLAVLATHADGQPYTSLVAFAATPDLSALLFSTTRATRKYANLHADARVAMLVDDRSDDDLDFHGAAALTAVGRVLELEGGERRVAADLLVGRHPALADFVASPSCALLRLEVETYYLVTRFQNVVELHMREG